MLWDGVGMDEAGARGGTRHTQHKPISIIINHKFLRQSAISTLGTSRSAKMDSQFLRNIICIPLTKVASAHPSINNFQISWCHMIDDTVSHPYKNFPKFFHIFYLADYSKVSTFFETLSICFIRYLFVYLLIVRVV